MLEFSFLVRSPPYTTMFPNYIDLQLDANTVWVWQANLNLPESSISVFWDSLADDERQRADRFRREIDRTSFIAARGILRALLGQYLQCDPRELQLSYRDRGKPFLADSSWQFNLSHSGGLALYAIAANRAVGIDIEAIRDLEIEQLAKRFFSDREYRKLCQLKGDRQTEAFFTYWTAKEAYLKATGEGLMGLQQVEILEEEDNFWLQLPHENPSHFSLKKLSPPPGYAAALAVEGNDWMLKCVTCNL